MDSYKIERMRMAQDEEIERTIEGNGTYWFEEEDAGDFFSNEVVVHDSDNIEINNTYLATSCNDLKDYIDHHGMEPFSQERVFFVVKMGNYVFQEKAYQYMLTHFMTRTVVQHFNFSAAELTRYMRFYEGKRVCMALSVLADTIDINLHLTAQFGWVARYDNNPNYCFTVNIGSAPTYMFISDKVEDRRCGAEHLHYTMATYPTEMFRVHRTFPSDNMTSAYSAMLVRPFMTIISEQVMIGNSLYVLDTESLAGVVSHCDDWDIQSFKGDHYSGNDLASLHNCIKKLLPAVFFVKGQHKEQVLCDPILPKLRYVGEKLIGLWDVDCYLRESWKKETARHHKAIDGVNQIRDKMERILSLFAVPLPKRPNYPSIGRQQVVVLYSGLKNQVKLVGRAKMRKVPLSVLDEQSEMYNPPNFNNFKRKPGQVKEVDIVGKTNQRVPIFIVQRPTSVLSYARHRRIPVLEVFHKIFLRPNQYIMEQVDNIYYFNSAWIPGLCGSIKSRYFFHNRSIFQQRDRVKSAWLGTVLSTFVKEEVYEEQLADLPFRRRSDVTDNPKWCYDREEDLNSYYRTEDTQRSKFSLGEDLEMRQTWDKIDIAWMQLQVERYEREISVSFERLALQAEQGILDEEEDRNSLKADVGMFYTSDE